MELRRRIELFIVILLSSISAVSAQDVVYFTKWNAHADRDVIIVNSPHRADLCVNFVNQRHELDYYDNSWYITQNRSEADFVFRRVSTSNGNRNAIRVYVYMHRKNNVPHRWKKAYEKIMKKIE